MAKKSNTKIIKIDVSKKFTEQEIVEVDAIAVVGIWAIVKDDSVSPARFRVYCQDEQYLPVDDYTLTRKSQAEYIAYWYAVHYPTYATFANTNFDIKVNERAEQMKIARETKASELKNLTKALKEQLEMSE